MTLKLRVIPFVEELNECTSLFIWLNNYTMKIVQRSKLLDFFLEL